ncbi:hypothetical protein EUX98_g182 [Antrodiella citrinella]|uniref:Uncharacterized protein n=1 Tax=Antrodiella citrinella TaxID=2447956 RepID=A0A4S4N4P6_9APHY|nr:hypothetical protein EUX98_g182 [Antrodiella citrinella]
MAIPESMTTLNLSGKYIMNKTLSDDPDEILRLQGVSWFTRRAISMATIYQSMKHYKDDSDVEHLDIDQVLSGGVAASTELRTLDWKERETAHSLFGAVLGRSRRVKLQDLEDEYLKQGWLPSVETDGAIQGIAQSDTAKSGTTWDSDQIFGLEEINGEKRHTRHIHFTGPGGESILARMVYDYGEHDILLCIAQGN